MALFGHRHIILDPDPDALPAVFNLRLTLRYLQTLTDVKARFNGEHSMGHLIETGITDLGLPSSLAGAFVALLILAPEALNSIQASISGEMQRSINTLYGSVLATVSLTVPAVLAIGVITHTRVILGLDPFSSVLLVLTLFLLRPMPRLTGIEGLMRLVVFGFWLLLQVF